MKKKKKEEQEEKTCKCGEITDPPHLRTSSYLCPLYNPRSSQLKPDIDDPHQYVKSQFGFTIKTSLKKILREKSLFTTINQLVSQVTIISYHASRLLNLHLLRLLEFNLPIPDIYNNNNFIRQVFTIVQLSSDSNFSKFDDELVATYKNHFQFQQHIVKLSEGFGQLLTIIVTTYLRNCEKHITDHYWINLKRYCKYKSIENIEDCLSFFENNPSIDDIRDKYGDDLTIFHQEELIQCIYRTSSEMENIKRQQLEIRIAELEIKMKSGKLSNKQIERCTRICNNIATFLKSEKVLKTYTIVPLCKPQAKNIKIDTDILYNLLGGVKTGYSNKADFGKQFQEESWRNTFDLESKWFHNVLDKKRFNYEIITDGISCSIGFRKYVKKDKKSLDTDGITIKKEKQRSFDKNRDDKKKQREITKEIRKKAKEKVIKEEETEEILDETFFENTVFIGTDPGEGTVLSNVIQYPDGYEEMFSISNGEYHHRCHHNQRMLWIDKRLRKTDIDGNTLKKWLSQTPTPRSPHMSSFVEYLKYTYNGEEFLKLHEHYLRVKTRMKRWNVYIQKQKAVNEICKELIDTIPKDYNIVVAFGDASWSGSVKGYNRSPRGLFFYKYMKNKYESDRIKVRSTSEYNSSQICSNCNKHERLVKYNNVVIEKPHFVKSCPTCFTIWNRDVNAARNLITIEKNIMARGKKPWIFSKQIPKDSEANRSRDATSSQFL